MSTEEQMKDRERLRRYIERERLTSAMSDAKWDRLRRVLDALPFRVRFRRRDVREAGPDPKRFGCDPSLSFVLGGAVSIEWLDLSARFEERRGQLVEPVIHDRTEELKNALLAGGVPFSMVDGYPRVWGYLRPGVSPEWATAG